jgi:hypothetical protein
MTNAKRLVLCAVFSMALIAALMAVQPSDVLAQGQQPKSISGMISSVQKGNPNWPASFTLDVADKTMIFFMHPKTKVEGEMKEKSKADVQYVIDGEGNNLAVAIKIS